MIQACFISKTVLLIKRPLQGELLLSVPKEKSRETDDAQMTIILLRKTVILAMHQALLLFEC